MSPQDLSFLPGQEEGEREGGGYRDRVDPCPTCPGHCTAWCPSIEEALLTDEGGGTFRLSAPHSPRIPASRKSRASSCPPPSRRARRETPRLRRPPPHTGTRARQAPDPRPTCRKHRIGEQLGEQLGARGQRAKPGPSEALPDQQTRGRAGSIGRGPIGEEVSTTSASARGPQSDPDSSGRGSISHVFYMIGIIRHTQT